MPLGFRGRKIYDQISLYSLHFPSLFSYISFFGQWLVSDFCYVYSRSWKGHPPKKTFPICSNCHVIYLLLISFVICLKSHWMWSIVIMNAKNTKIMCSRSWKCFPVVTCFAIIYLDSARRILSIVLFFFWGGGVI